MTSLDWLLAGQALERVLLVACRHGLQASYLNQPIQVAPLRPKLRELVGGGFPQILLRLGYPGDEIHAAPGGQSKMSSCEGPPPRRSHIDTPQGLRKRSSSKKAKQ